MADLTALASAVSALVQNQAAVIARLSALEAGGASPQDQSNIDSITAQVTGVNTALAAAVASAPH